mmetsp:Transcript_13158/g.45022  ORF Transcript_13158/g.45022 Transcript_13158/m.45022 type:complete len:245 (+) Transcript_13158:384-1118(+)
MPTLTRFRCPPEMPRRTASPTTACRRRSMRSTRSTSRTTARRNAEDEARGSRVAALKSRISLTVSSVHIVSSCGTKPITDRSPRRLGVVSPFTESAPITDARTSPRPASTQSSDVLPAPDGPMTARTRPDRASPVAPSRTRRRRPSARTSRPRSAKPTSMRSASALRGSDGRSRARSSSSTTNGFVDVELRSSSSPAAGGASPRSDDPRAAARRSRIASSPASSVSRCRSRNRRSSARTRRLLW